MKNKILVFIIIAALALTTAMQQLTIVNLKKKQGSIYKYNFDCLRLHVKQAQEYLSGTVPLTKDEIDRYYWEFDEYQSFTSLLPSASVIDTYIGIIHLDLNEISHSIKNNEPKSNIENSRKQALALTIQLENALNAINAKCNNNYLKYCDLEKAGNNIMKNINKNLLDYLNKNNIH